MASSQKKFRTNLQVMRKRAGFKSAREFAERYGYNVSTFTKYEQGTAMMSLELAWEFADLLDCTIDELAGRRVPDQPLVSQVEQRLLDVYRSADEHGQTLIDAVIDGEARHMDELALKETRSA